MEKEHEQTLELLPWYVNDTLSGKDEEVVLKHLADCRACQTERDRLYEIQDVIQESDTPLMGYELSLRRVMRRVELSEKNRESTEDVELLQRVLQQKHKYLPIGIAASIFSLVMAGAAWMNFDNSSSINEFQTLSTEVPNVGSMHRMELGFVSPIPAATLRQALIETHSNIVSGPDQNGNYLVEVVVPNSLEPADFLARIRHIEGVERARFAEN